MARKPCCWPLPIARRVTELAWVAETVGFRKAKIAVARKLVIILQRMWQDRTNFRPGKKQPAT